MTTSATSEVVMEPTVDDSHTTTAPTMAPTMAPTTTLATAIASTTESVTAEISRTVSLGDGRYTVIRPDVNEEFERLIAGLSDDMSALESLTPEKTDELRRYMNPYGRIIAGEPKYTCISITNFSQEYMRAFIMTSLVGFLYRMCDEYGVEMGEYREPTRKVAEKGLHVYKCRRAVEELKKHAERHKKAQAEFDEAKIAFETKRIEFDKAFAGLCELFGDRILSSMYKPEELDENSEIPEPNEYHADAFIKEIVEDQAIPLETRKEHSLTISRANSTMRQRSALRHVLRLKTEALAKVNEMFERAKNVVISLGMSVDDPKYDTEPESDQRVIIWQFLNSLFHFNPDEHVRSSFVSNPADPERTPLGTIPRGCGVVDDFTEHIPPADTYLRWKFYEDANFESLKDAVRDIHGLRSDIEYAVIVYDTFATKEEAEQFKDKFRNELITDMYIITNNGWTLLGSYSQNRERIDFYNKNTQILEQMMAQVTEDRKLGADLMRKRVRKMKKKNIAEVGPDHPSFVRHKQENPTDMGAMGAEDLGAKPGEEITEDAPEDAVNVDVYQFRDGGRKMDVGRFYSQSDRPEMVQKKARDALTRAYLTDKMSGDRGISLTSPVSTEEVPITGAIPRAMPATGMPMMRGMPIMKGAGRGIGAVADGGAPP